jgi:hypothetical protein
MSVGHRLWCPRCTTPIDFVTHGWVDKWVAVENDPGDLLVSCPGCCRVFELFEDKGQWFALEKQTQ